MKRTFIAIPVTPSENLLKIIRELPRQLEGDAIKWVETGNLHFTLKFLGETSEKQLPVIIAKLDKAGSFFSRVNGTLTGLDYFSVRGMPSVLFSKIEGMPGLEKLAKVLDVFMEEEGFLPEQRNFRPHLTLARIRSLKNLNRFKDLIGRYRSAEIQPLAVEKIILYESILQPEGPLYLPLHTLHLKPET